MPPNPTRSRWRFATIAAGLTTVVLAPVGPAAAHVAEPDGELRSSVRHNQWTIQLYTGEGATEIAVRHRQGGLEAVLRPDRDLRCPSDGPASGCRPAIDLPRPSSLRGRGMVVQAHTPDRFHPPEIVTVMHTGGASCCFTAIGYWRGQDGPWRHRTINGGSTPIVTDGKGRIRVGDRRWETLDWPYAASRPYLTWRTLTPTAGGASWKNTSTIADHQRELRAATSALRKLQRGGGGTRGAQQRATRAVIVAHRKALGQTAQMHRDRSRYRRLFGSTSLKRLDRALKRIAHARRG